MNNNENVFEFDGVTYVATEDKVPGECDGCAFQYVSCHMVPGCQGLTREDLTDVIWIEHKPFVVDNRNSALDNFIEKVIKFIFGVR
jgi:hypothetical protein